MKRKIAFLLVCLMAVGVYAEKDLNRVKEQKARLFGFSIGYTQCAMFETLPLLTAQPVGTRQQNRYHGVQGGIVVNPEFGAGVGILLGAHYVYTPTYVHLGMPNDHIKTSISQHDLTLPLRLQYRYAFTPGFSIFAYTGPAFSIGLVWNKKESITIDGKKVITDEYDFYDRKNHFDYARLHAYWGIGAGIILNQHLRAEIYGDWGINNITPFSDIFTHLNRPINVAISYML